MKRTSRVLNFCLFGSINETVCARVLRHVDNGSRVAEFLAFLIDLGFYATIREADHVKGPQ